MRLRTARDIMSDPVKVLRGSTDAADAAALLLSWGHAAAPVVDAGGTVIGVVTEELLVRHVREAIVRQARPPRVDDIVIGSVHTVTPDADLARVIAELEHAPACRLLVMHGRDVVGIITPRDTLRALVELDRRADVVASNGHDRPPVGALLDRV